MGCNLIINALNLEAGHVLKGASNETVTAKAAYINRTVSPLETHQTAENSINANESLTQQGKMDAVKKVGTEKTAPALKWVKEEIAELEKKDQRLRATLFTITSGIDNSVERAVTFNYLWTKLDPLDQAARVTQFVQAAERDDRTVMAAMLDNPFGPMVNEEVKARALTARAQRLMPNDYHNYEQNQILLEFLTMARNWIAKWLVEEVGVEDAVIRTTFGDEVADTLSGMTQFVGA